ncbi:hypothetical protein GCM10027589_23400 [Actinocorallia lasiicapitis]
MIVFNDIARQHLAGHRDERWVIWRVEEALIRTEYPSKIIDPPLGGFCPNRRQIALRVSRLFDVGAILDNADKIASVVGGVLALVVFLRESRIAGRPIFMSACGLAGLGPLIAAVWMVPVRIPLIVAGTALEFLAAVAFARHVIRRRRDRARLPEEIRLFLERLRSTAEEGRYEFGSLVAAPLERVYVEQRALGGGPVEQHAAESGVQPHETPALTVRDLLSRHRHIVLEAPAGGGKTSVLGKIVADCAEWWLTERSRAHAPLGGGLAVRIRATSLLGAELSVALGAAFGTDGDLFSRSPLPGHHWFVLVDGLDEIVDVKERLQVLRKLMTIMRQDESPVRLMISTRPLTSEENAELAAAGAVCFRLQPFDKASLDAFVTRWFDVRRHGNMTVQELTLGFSTEVKRAGITEIVRIPLLATMAIMIFEKRVGRNPTLPSSRSELYGEFINLLGEGRPAVSNGPSAEITKWLVEWSPRLLAVAARAAVEGRADTLLSEVENEIRRERPGILPSQWIGALPGVLMSTGMFNSTSIGEGIDFLHRSIAEYLIAAEQPFLEGRWRAEVRDPIRRSLALFTLARSAMNVDAVVDRLLTTDGPIGPGHVLVDGMQVCSELRAQIIEELFTLLPAEPTTMGECLELLMGLPDPFVREHLEDLARDNTFDAWIRASIADSLAETDRESGLPTTVITELELNHPRAAYFLILRLLGRGDPRVSGRLDHDPANFSEDLPAFAIPLIVRAAEDPLQVVTVRRGAAATLLAQGHTEGFTVLNGLAQDPDSTDSDRLAAALLLIRFSASPDAAPDAYRVLGELIAGSELRPEETVEAAAALAPNNDSRAAETLERLIRAHAPDTHRAQGRGRGWRTWVRAIQAPALAPAARPSPARSDLDELLCEAAATLLDEGALLMEATALPPRRQAPRHSDVPNERLLAAAFEALSRFPSAARRLFALGGIAGSEAAIFALGADALRPLLDAADLSPAEKMRVAGYLIVLGDDPSPLVAALHGHWGRAHRRPAAGHLMLVANHLTEAQLADLVYSGVLPPQAVKSVIHILSGRSGLSAAAVLCDLATADVLESAVRSLAADRAFALLTGTPDLDLLRRLAAPPQTPWRISTLKLLARLVPSEEAGPFASRADFTLEERTAVVLRLLRRENLPQEYLATTIRQFGVALEQVLFTEMNHRRLSPTLLRVLLEPGVSTDNLRNGVALALARVSDDREEVVRLALDDTLHGTVRDVALQNLLRPHWRARNLHRLVVGDALAAADRRSLLAWLLTEDDRHAGTAERLCSDDLAPDDRLALAAHLAQAGHPSTLSNLALDPSTSPEIATAALRLLRSHSEIPQGALAQTVRNWLATDAPRREILTELCPDRECLSLIALMDEQPLHVRYAATALLFDHDAAWATTVLDSLPANPKHQAWIEEAFDFLPDPTSARHTYRTALSSTSGSRSPAASTAGSATSPPNSATPRTPRPRTQPAPPTPNGSHASPRPP